MKRMLLPALMCLLTAGTASADYVLVKINLNQLDFFPNSLLAPPAQIPGVTVPAQPMPGQPGMPQGGMPGMIPGGMMPGGMQQFPVHQMPGGRGMPVRPGMGGGVRGPGGVNRPGMMPPVMQPGLQPGVQMQPQPQQPPPPPPPGQAGGQPAVPQFTLPEDPNPKWVSAYVEFKSLPSGVGATPMGNAISTIWKYDHPWGKGIWLPYSPHYPIYFVDKPMKDPYIAEFDATFKKESQAKNANGFMYLARMALSRGRLKDFHRAMKEVVQIDPKNVIVVNYQRVQKELENPFKNTDPAQAEFVEDLKKNGYTQPPEISKKGHYAMYAQIFATDRATVGLVERRLAMMEHMLEVFYYWFAMQADSCAQPAIPKYRLVAVLAKDKQDFNAKHAEVGGMPLPADGFTPRRENIIIMSPKPRVSDPVHAEFELLLNNKLAELNNKLQQNFKVSITREDLLSGEINKNKDANKAALFIAAAQTAVMLSKSIEAEAERATVTSETIRQLLVASESFPRNVQIPEWMVEGLAAFFETPIGAVYPTVGAPSWTHLISFKYLRNIKRLDDPTETLRNVITDKYFQAAREATAQFVSTSGSADGSSDQARREAKQAWEMARCTSWSFVFYLSESKQLGDLFKYGKELDKLPRDMDLDEPVLQGCFARGFGITDPKDPRRINQKKMKDLARGWFESMQGVNLALVDVQTFLLQKREQEDAVPGSVQTGTTTSDQPATTPQQPQQPQDPNQPQQPIQQVPPQQQIIINQQRQPLRPGQPGYRHPGQPIRPGQPVRPGQLQPRPPVQMIRPPGT